MGNDQIKRDQIGTLVGIIGNLLLAAMKGIIGWFAGSKALMADALHSASYAASLIATLVGLRKEHYTFTRNHVRERNKIARMAAIVVAVLLLFVGFEIARSSVISIIEGVDAAPHGYAVMATMISMLIKEAVFIYRYRLGKAQGRHVHVSHALEHRSELISSLIVLVGIAGSLVGELMDLPLLYYLDPIAAIIVALLVLRMGIQSLIKAIQATMAYKLIPDEAERMKNLVLAIHGVISLDHLQAIEEGHYVRIMLTIRVDPQFRVFEADLLAQEVEQHIKQEFREVCSVDVIVKPFDTEFPYQNHKHVLHDDFGTILQ